MSAHKVTVEALNLKGFQSGGFRKQLQAAFCGLGYSNDLFEYEIAPYITFIPDAFKVIVGDMGIVEVQLVDVVSTSRLSKDKLASIVELAYRLDGFLASVDLHIVSDTGVATHYLPYFVLDHLGLWPKGHKEGAEVDWRLLPTKDVLARYSRLDLLKEAA